jgi:hypothetical protein
MIVTDKLETIKPTDAQLKARRNRNIAIGIALGLFVILVYVVSFVRLGPAILDRSM